MFRVMAQLKNYLKVSRQLARWGNSLQIEQYRHEHLIANPKYTEKHLQRHEFQTCSQNGEDGIIAELFRRIGTTNKTFVEFGVEGGIENNTVNLLRDGWSGLWIEGSERWVNSINRTHADVITSRRLTVLCSMVDAENIESLLSTGKVPQEIDLLSIDIDGNDWYVWRAIRAVNPRVVIVEYNSHFNATEDVIVEYRPTSGWDGTFYFGASLAAFDALARTKGYSLVGCDFTGTNAFFVRDDLLGDHFAGPFTPAHHYEPCRFYLSNRLGHRQRYGIFTKSTAQLAR